LNLIKDIVNMNQHAIDLGNKVTFIIKVISFESVDIHTDTHTHTPDPVLYVDH